MRLSRVRIEALRQFDEAIEIDGLQEGVNLFVGPNGAGKSTIVRAIRAAFFERYGSSSVSDLLPWGEPGAGPSVEVDFVCGDQRYRLRKRFLAKKRCSLVVDGKSLENAEAEARLADLMGFQYAAKGASRPEHWGVPGLLWIQQGCGQDLHGSVDHATDHLRKALDESLGEVASTGGDEIFERVQAERDRMLTRTGQPAGELKEATSRLAVAADRLASLTAQLAEYREQLERFGLLTVQIQSANRDQPWKRFEAQARAAQEQLERIRQLRESLEADRQLLAQSECQLRLLEQQQASFADQALQLEQRRQASCATVAGLAEADAELLARGRQLEAAQRCHESAQAVLIDAECGEQRRHLLERITRLRKQHDALQGAVALATEITARLNRHRQEIATGRVRFEQLESLRRNERDIQAARIRLDAAATRLTYELEPGRTLERDGSELRDSGQAQLVGRTVLKIPEVGTLTIEPGGGQDLAQLATVRNGLEAAQAALLQSLGLDSIADAEKDFRRRQAAEQDAQVEEARLGQLAPKGPDALAADLAEVCGELAAARGRLPRTDATGEDDLQSPLPGMEVAVAVAAGVAAAVAVAEARTSHADAGRRLDQARVCEQEARAAWTTAKAAAFHAEGELAVLQAALQSDAHRRRVAQNLAELQATRLRFGVLEARVRDMAGRIDAARPQVIQQDAERLDRSARQARDAHELNRNELARLQFLLDAAGAGGLEEQLAEAGGDLERLQRRHRELQCRAKALDLLAQALRTKRQALTKRLQAPLLKHLNHYLQLLMPGASVTIDEALRPVALSWPGAGGGEGCYEELSYGTREQISLISRLAYADLLKEASRPTLIILDDCLVNTDTARMSQMKRILFDAATRHQILLFSCHPERWQDLGAAARDVLSLKHAQRRPDAARLELAAASTMESDAS